MSWRATVLTIFPEMLPGPLAYSLAGKALEAGIWQLETVDIRDFARDKHRSVDDAPFGGGPGMIMRPDVLDAAISGAGGLGPLILLSPRGRPLGQERVRELAAMPGVRLICGRVLSGGEPAAIALIDACVRLLPGVVGGAETLAEESFAEGLLEYPHYTRPQLWQGRAVPDVLVSGDHQRVRNWRRAQSCRRCSLGGAVMRAYWLREWHSQGHPKNTPVSITRLNGRRAQARPFSDRSPPKDS